MRRTITVIVAALGFLALAGFGAMASVGDVNCCKACCRGANCIMRPGQPAHMCVKAVPCK